jgi:predicted GIY-YIG superfamily endonuclease
LPNLNVLIKGLTSFRGMGSMLRRRYEVYVLLDDERMVRYVGCTRNPDKRRKEHLRGARTSRLVYETYEVFGEDKKTALAAEQSLIRTLLLLGHDLLNVAIYKSEEEKEEEARLRNSEIRRRERIRGGMRGDNDSLDAAEKIIRRGERQGKWISEEEWKFLEKILEKFGVYLD